MIAVRSMRDVAAGAATCLTGPGRDAIVAFTSARRSSCGGYMGKSNTPDLYYTLFAAGTLDALAQRHSLLRLPRYLAQFGDGRALDFVHAACLARLLGAVGRRARQRAVLPRLETFRSQDGGYHHATVNAPTGSAYAAYLALDTYADARVAPPQPGHIRSALDILRTPDHAWANEPGSQHGQTNATAAACLACIHLGQTPEPGAAQFLLAQRDPVTGGFHAYPGAPMPDLLSTASALYALNAMNVPLQAIAPQTRAFIETLWTDEGGFCGGFTDSVPDCEYTFYALLALGALM